MKLKANGEHGIIELRKETVKSKRKKIKSKNNWKLLNQRTD